MNQKLGSKDGKNNRRLLFLNKKRKKNLQVQEIEEKKKKEVFKKRQKEDEIITISNKDRNENISIKEKDNDLTEYKKISKIYHGKKNDKIIEGIPKETPIKSILEEDEINTLDNHENKKIRPSTNDENNQQKIVAIVPKKSKQLKQTPIQNDNKQEKNIENEDNKTIDNHIKKAKKQEEEIKKDADYLEKQIIKILEQQLEENKYQLRKIDSEIHSIEKIVDSLKNEEEVEEIEKQIEILLDKIKQLKNQIESLKKTFDLDFPVDEPDNYLIYLVEEYEDKRRLELELSEKLKQNQEFKSFIDEIIEIEAKHDSIKNQVQNKKDNIELDNEEIEKVNNEIVSIEEMKEKIDNMLSEQNNLLEEIKLKVAETVHITERVETITKSVNHSLLDLLLLMSIFKHNLSLQGSVVAAVTAKLALDMIIQMTTPIEENVIVHDNDLVDYEKLINNCLTDTNKLENIMETNLNSISSIRYTFEHTYKDCSYLDSYKEAMEKLNNIEEELKDKKNDVKRIKKETELQLEKNNAKVKKYGSMAA